MNIFELEKEKKILESKLISRKERIELERSKLDNKAIDYSKPAVQSSPHKDSMLDAVARISMFKSEVNDLTTQLEQNKKEIDRLYNIFGEYKERDKQIYIEKKLYKWSNAKISLKHKGIGKSQIYRILEKIEENFKNGKKGE